MVQIVYYEELVTGLLSTIVASICLLILTLVLAFFWYQWVFVRPYKHLPSTRMDTKWLFKAITGRYPKNASLTSVFFQEIIKRSKRFQKEGFFLMWLVKPYIVFYNEEFSKTFCAEPSAMNKAFIYVLAKDIFGNGIATSKDQMWRTHRKLLNPAFSSGALRDKIPIFNENAAELVQTIHNLVDEPIDDLIEILKLRSFNIMSESIFGLKLNDDKYGSKVKNYMENFDKGSKLFIDTAIRPWEYCLLPLFKLHRKNRDVVRSLNAFIKEIVQELKKSIMRSKKLDEHSDNVASTRKSVAEILIEQHLKDASFTLQDVHDNVQTFVIGGYDTVSYALMWIFYIMGHHLDVQEKVFDEIESIVTGHEVSCEELCKMKYLDCVIKETLRLYPVGPMYGRTLSKDIKCGEYLVPKNTDLVFFPFLLHRNPDIYPDPEKFDPDRFSDGTKIRPGTYITFSEGYRSCLGKKLAFLEMKVLLAHVLRRFRIASLNKVEVSDLDWQVMLKPVTPIRMLFTVREAHTSAQRI